MPSNQEIGRWLIDIQHHIALAERFLGNMSYDIFKGDDLRLYAIVRCLEIISEASRRLPDSFKQRYSDISWKEMAAAGNVYRHEYETVRRPAGLAHGYARSTFAPSGNNLRTGPA